VPVQGALQRFPLILALDDLQRTCREGLPSLDVSKIKYLTLQYLSV
jgi:hypothetical protein